jgi:hypothetical protein
MASRAATIEGHVHHPVHVALAGGDGDVVLPDDFTMTRRAIAHLGVRARRRLAVAIVAAERARARPTRRRGVALIPRPVTPTIHAAHGGPIPNRFAAGELGGAAELHLCRPRVKNRRRPGARDGTRCKRAGARRSHPIGAWHVRLHRRPRSTRIPEYRRGALARRRGHGTACSRRHGARRRRSRAAPAP